MHHPDQAAFRTDAAVKGKFTRRTLTLILFLSIQIGGAGMASAEMTPSNLPREPKFLPSSENNISIARSSTIWDDHKVLIVGSLAVSIAQLLTIALLVISRRRRVATEKLLLQSEDAYRVRLNIAFENNRQREEGLELLLDLNQRSSVMTERQTLDLALDIALRTTKSTIGYLRLINGDRNTISFVSRNAETIEYCTSGTATVYSIYADEILADCVRTRLPVVHNDYQKMCDGKPYPVGHVSLMRCLSVPALKDDHVQMIVGVGNKQSDYEEQDVAQLQQVANEVQKIVSRRRIEQALQDSEARFRFITDLSPGMIWVADANHLCTWVNRTWLNFTGRRMEQELGGGWAESIHPEDLESARPKFKSHFAARKPFVLEYRVRNHDGQYRWVLDTGQPRFDEHAVFVGYVGTCLDISERKKVEAQAQHISQLYAALSRCNEAIVRCTSQSELFESICRSTANAGSVKMAWIGLVDPASQWLRPTAFAGDSVGYLANIRISLDQDDPLGQGPTALAIRKNEPYWCQDFLNDPVTSPWHDQGARAGWAASASLPLHHNGQVVGSYTLYAGEVNAFNDDIRKLLLELSMNISFAIGNFERDAARKRAEEQLHKLAQAVEQSSESIVITNLNAEIEYVNEAFVRITGYSREEALGKNPRILNSGQTPPKNYVDLWDALPHGRAWQGEFYNRRKDGSTYIEFVRISPVREIDGRITHYLAIKEDITEKKRAAETIRESKLLLQRVIDSTPDWIYVKDRGHRFMLVNEPFAKYFNESPNAMIGRSDADFLPHDACRANAEDGMPGLHEHDDFVFEGQSIHLPFEKIVFENGKTRIFDTFKAPLRDASQLTYGMLCYRRDVTERFNNEKEQEALEKQLLQAQKMELIGHLTGGIAHDFNNILSAIFGYAELVQMSPDIQNNPQLNQYLHEILQAGIRAKELVAQLLTFSHRRELASEAILVAPIVNEVTKLLRATIPTSISIHATLARNLPLILISPIHLHQIVMNLSINARDASGDSGQIEIKAEQATLHGSAVCSSCHVRFNGNYVLISVGDSGSGISQENLAKIFDPFFTTKDVGRGSGLGLSVLHGIVHSANGHVEVLTAPGKGSEFRVYLPAQLPETHGLHSTVGKHHESSQVCGHVMVVDDDPSIVGFIKALLESLGCHVTGLTSATEALRLFRENPNCVDMVITDQTMPDLTGAELARAMLLLRPSIPIVLSTGYSNTMDEDTALKIGVRRFLEKPVPAKIFAAVVAECLSVKSPEK